MGELTSHLHRRVWKRKVLEGKKGKMSSFPFLLALVSLAMLQTTADSSFIAEEEGGKDKRKAGSYIVGGQEIPRHSEPYMVFLERPMKNGRFMTCAGAAIAPRWILTAAHCFPPFNARNPSGIKVITGMHEKKFSKTWGIYQVQKVFTYPDYYHAGYGGGKTIYNSEGTSRNDIALLYLKRKITLTNSKTIKLIPLNRDEECPKDKEKCFVAGWGKISHGGNSSFVPLGVNLTVLDHKSCAAYAKNTGNLLNTAYSDTTICVAPGPKSSCVGDSGGTLVCTCSIEGKKRRVHAGVVSGGFKCGGGPGYYTRTSDYLPWIKRCIKSRGEDCPNHILNDFPDASLQFNLYFKTPVPKPKPNFGTK